MFVNCLSKSFLYKTAFIVIAGYQVELFKRLLLEMPNLVSIPNSKGENLLLFLVQRFPRYLEPPKFIRVAFQNLLENWEAVKAMLLSGRQEDGKSSTVSVQAGTALLDKFTFCLVVKCPVELMDILTKTITAAVKDEKSGSSARHLARRFVDSVVRIFVVFSIKYAAQSIKNNDTHFFRDPLSRCHRVFKALIDLSIEELCVSADALITPVRLGLVMPTSAPLKRAVSDIEATVASERLFSINPLPPPIYPEETFSGDEADDEFEWLMEDENAAPLDEDQERAAVDGELEAEGVPMEEDLGAPAESDNVLILIPNYEEEDDSEDEESDDYNSSSLDEEDLAQRAAVEHLIPPSELVPSSMQWTVGHPDAANTTGVTNNRNKRAVSSTPTEDAPAEVRLARAFGLIVREVTSLLSLLSTSSVPPEGSSQHVSVTQEESIRLRELAQSLLEPSWKWLATAMDTTEAQLRFGLSRSTGLNIKMSAHPDDFLSYCLSLMRAQNGEHADSLPVMDVTSMKHIAYVFDALMYYMRSGKIAHPESVLTPALIKDKYVHTLKYFLLLSLFRTLTKLRLYQSWRKLAALRLSSADLNQLFVWISSALTRSRHRWSRPCH